MSYLSLLEFLVSQTLLELFQVTLVWLEVGHVWKKRHSYEATWYTPHILANMTRILTHIWWYILASKGGLRSTLRPSVSRFWHRASIYAIVFEFPSCLCADIISTCVCLRHQKQCLRSKKRQLLRVAHVLLLRPVAGASDISVNRFAVVSS